MMQSLSRGCPRERRHDDGFLHHARIRVDEVLHDAEAVDPRHHEIEDDRVEELVSVEMLDRLLAVGGLDGLEAGAAEDAENERTDGRLVVGDEDAELSIFRHWPLPRNNAAAA